MTSWDRRIERAAELQNKVPAAAEVLRFYRSIAEFQRNGPASRSALQNLIEQKGPLLLAEAARNNTEPALSFCDRVLRQAEAVRDAACAKIPAGITRNTCPFCGERPVAAVRRPEGEGGKRGLVCSLCFTEWEFRRLLCPYCGEEDHQKLPIYTSPEFPHVHVEACDACGHYLKAVDLTVDGYAVAEVDEMAAVALDLWAAENGLTKISRNILDM